MNPLKLKLLVPFLLLFPSSLRASIVAFDFSGIINEGESVIVGKKLTGSMSFSLEAPVLTVGPDYTYYRAVTKFSFGGQNFSFSLLHPDFVHLVFVANNPPFIGLTVGPTPGYLNVQGVGIALGEVFVNSYGMGDSFSDQSLSNVTQFADLPLKDMHFDKFDGVGRSFIVSDLTISKAESGTEVPVPEPVSGMSFCVGLVGLGLVWKRFLPNKK